MIRHFRVHMHTAVSPGSTYSEGYVDVSLSVSDGESEDAVRERAVRRAKILAVYTALEVDKVEEIER